MSMWVEPLVAGRCGRRVSVRVSSAAASNADQLLRRSSNAAGMIAVICLFFACCIG